MLSLFFTKIKLDAGVRKNSPTTDARVGGGGIYSILQIVSPGRLLTLFLGDNPHNYSDPSLLPRLYAVATSNDSKCRIIAPPFFEFFRKNISNPKAADTLETEVMIFLWVRHATLPSICYEAVRTIPTLYSQDNWDHDRALVGLLEEEAGDGVGDVVFDVVEVDRLHVVGCVLDRFLDDEARLREEVLVLAQVHEAARDDVGRRKAGYPAMLILGARSGKTTTPIPTRLALAAPPPSAVFHSAPVGKVSTI